MTTTKAKKRGAPAASKAQAAKANGSAVDRMVAAQQDPHAVTNGEKPEPQPGEKGFDWAKVYPDEKVFVYTTPKGMKDNRGNDVGGTTVGLAAISEKRQPSVGFLRRVRHKQEFDQIVDMIEMVAADEALTILDQWNPSELQDLFEQWNEWAQTTVGKP